MKPTFFILTVLVVVLFQVCQSYYLPGLPQQSFVKGSIVKVKTRKITSSRNLPYDFYSLKFCRPDPIDVDFENLGEYFFGDRIENSVYNFQFLTPVTCQRIATCQSDICKPYHVECPTLTSKDIKDFKAKIEEDYIAQLIIDNLPVANSQDSSKDCGHLPPEKTVETKKYARPDGYPIGCKFIMANSAGKRYTINNHLTFTIKYHKKSSSDEYLIVGAEVIPSSIAHTEDSCKPENAFPTTNQKLELTDDLTHIPFSYSVRWVPSDIRWASRWDAYLNTGDGEEQKIHWFSIVNSLMIVLFLSGMVIMIMTRVLHRDILNYNRIDNEDPTEETGWKLVHGDVFRVPKFFTLLSILIGSGIQTLGITLVTLIFAVLGFLSPANRGSLLTAVLFLYAFMGIIAGYVSLKVYKMYGGEYWKTTSVLTAFLFPAVIFGIFLVINFVAWIAVDSTIAVQFLNLLALFAMFVGINVPLVFVGSYFGYRGDAMKQPVQTHKIPRQIPSQPIYMRPPVSILIGGILPFGAVFIELYFIMSSVWLQKFYYIFGFIFIVFAILLLTCAEITIVMTYFQLCNEDYKWHWRSFLTPGSSAIYLFLYSIFYYVTRLQADSFVLGVVFFGYMSIVSYFFFILTGSIGYFATLWFVRKIYSSIRID